MSNPIKVPLSAISALSFNIKAIDISGTNSNISDAFVYTSHETGEDVQGVPVYNRTAWGEVDYEAQYQGQNLELSFTWLANAQSNSYKESFDFDIDESTDSPITKNFIFIDEDLDEEDLQICEIQVLAQFFGDFSTSALDLCPEPDAPEELDVSMSQ